MAILITGAAGYIGSHVLKELKNPNSASKISDKDIVLVDNLNTGHELALLGHPFYHFDISDTTKLEELFNKYSFDSVIHFAAHIVVPESVSNPLKYYSNNTANTLKLLVLCEKYKVKNFVFSSTAAVYGIPTKYLSLESDTPHPINPYGNSKLMTETMIQDFCTASSMRAVILRYFNVAGADQSGLIGQSFPNATHLIKVACEVAIGKRPFIEIFGTDFSTADGTCIRDYIHVSDLASAHVSALDYLNQGGETVILNCGYSKGHSVKEVIAVVEKVSKVNLDVRVSGRRAGDPPAVVSDSAKIQKVLTWRPKYNDLALIVDSALKWEKNPKF